jgi:hypothetical protein
MIERLGGRLEAAWVRNQGAACTSACVLAALGALGASRLPSLPEGSVRLGARLPLGAPRVLDYLGMIRRPPLDLRIEAMARDQGLQLRSQTRLHAPALPLRPLEDGLLIAHLVWGQEAPGRFGSWGWNPLVPASYASGGHSVVLVSADDSGWTVLDPNHPQLQHWPRRGLALSWTAIRPV